MRKKTQETRKVAASSEVTVKLAARYTKAGERTMQVAGMYNQGKGFRPLYVHDIPKGKERIEEGEDAQVTHHSFILKPGKVWPRSKEDVPAVMTVVTDKRGHLLASIVKTVFGKPLCASPVENPALIPAHEFSSPSMMRRINRWISNDHFTSIEYEKRQAELIEKDLAPVEDAFEPMGEGDLLRLAEGKEIEAKPRQVKEVPKTPARHGKLPKPAQKREVQVIVPAEAEQEAAPFGSMSAAFAGAIPAKRKENVRDLRTREEEHPREKLKSTLPAKVQRAIHTLENLGLEPSLIEAIRTSFRKELAH